MKVTILFVGLLAFLFTFSTQTFAYIIIFNCDVYKIKYPFIVNSASDTEIETSGH
jgi:hypothetical protein